MPWQHALLLDTETRCTGSLHFYYPLCSYCHRACCERNATNRNKWRNTVDLLEHANDQTVLCNTFIFGVQNEVYLREQRGRERDGGLLAQQGKELLYFALRVPSLLLICAVGQRTDPGKGQHLITYSYQSERLALEKKKKGATLNALA